MQWIERHYDCEMENSSISNLTKRKSTFNPWNDARILTHIIGKTSDIAHLRCIDANVMPTRSSNHNTTNIGRENYYNTADKPSFGYLNANNSTLPYSINTVHLQNPYRPSQRLEGFASRDHSKVRYRLKKNKISNKKNFNFVILCVCESFRTNLKLYALLIKIICSVFI